MPSTLYMPAPAPTPLLFQSSSGTFGLVVQAFNKIDGCVYAAGAQRDSKSAVELTTKDVGSSQHIEQLAKTISRGNPVAMQEGHLIPDPANIDYDNRSILGMLLPSTAKTKEVKMCPGAAKNARNLCVLRWLMQANTDGTTEEFRWYDALAIAPVPYSHSGSPRSPRARYLKTALVLAPCVPCVPAIQRRLSFWLPTAFPACPLSKGNSPSGSPHFLCASIQRLLSSWCLALAVCPLSTASSRIWCAAFPVCPLSPTGCLGAGTYSPRSRVG
ncbi:hypothetical protein EDC04DRAFT_3094810 [Pisolithus marmoratus]|nr:hypothetical protein EDC04DRAFT_3094810 [Pisolithus marmoratus]